MFATILFIAAVGLLVGAYMGRGGNQAGWCLLTVPMSAVMMGIPLAAALALLLLVLPDPLFGLPGPWRAVLPAAFLYAAGGAMITSRAAPSAPRRTARTIRAAIKYGAFGALLGCLWGLLHTRL